MKNKIISGLKLFRKFKAAVVAAALVLLCSLLNLLTPTPRAHADSFTPSAYEKARITSITNATGSGIVSNLYMAHGSNFTSQPFPLFKGRGITLWDQVGATNTTGLAGTTTNVISIVQVSPDLVNWVSIATNTDNCSSSATNNYYHLINNQTVDNAQWCQLLITAGTNVFFSEQHTEFP